MIQKVKEKALSLVGQGYIYGAKGQKCTKAFREQQAQQYPDQADNILGTGAKWDGMPVWDCAQLTRAVAKAGGVTLVSGATSQWTKTKWADSGTIDTLPPGELVFLYRRQNGGDTVMAHTGVTLGDGTCVHARGTAYGVVRQDMSQHAWTHWARPVWPGEEEKLKGDKPMLYEATVNASSGGTVNLRTEPNTSASRVTRVPVFATVKVMEEGDGWHRVQHENYTGWMMSQYLTKKTDENTDTVSVTLPKDVAKALYEALKGGGW